MRTDTVDLVLDHAELAQPVRLGWAHAQPSGTFGVRVRITLDEVPASLATAIGTLDPDLRWHAGDQYPAGNRPTFGLLQDIAPDRWGRRLMDRRHARDRRLGVITGPARLSHWDYLLGVDDRFRLGALRLRGPEGRWIDDGARGAVPPIAQLRTLEHQARVVEEDPEGTSDEDIHLLMAPGSSLGGARPKATVVDDQRRIWIAKFPSIADEDDIGLWEMVVNALARQCGILVPTMVITRLASRHHTVRSLRFDRLEDGRRRHVASAMTLTGHQDGDGAATGASYLEIARSLTSGGANPDQCLPQLWRRIVFNMLVCNADDHLRNHACVLRAGAGWELAPAYDMNPVPGARDLALTVSEDESRIDLELARSVAHLFRVEQREARRIIGEMQAVVRRWREVAALLSASAVACDRMASAFRLADPPRLGVIERPQKSL